MGQVLLIVGSLIFGFLGSVHLIYTFYSKKFEPYNNDTKKSMEESTLVLTKETSVWNAWVGFNTSHSFGAILIALFFIPLSIFNNEVIQNSQWFSILPSLIGVCYLILAVKYWFKIPAVGILLATFCFMASAIAYNF